MTWIRDWGSDCNEAAGAKPDASLVCLVDEPNYETPDTKNYYSPNNVFADGLGHWIIEGRLEEKVYKNKTFHYTAGRIKTKKDYATPGKATPAPSWRAESVCQIPTDNGIWPCAPFFLAEAFNWMAPPRGTAPGITWPQCGEIDNNEHYTIGRNQIRFNVVRADQSWVSNVLTLPFNIDEGFHKYTTEVMQANVAKQFGYSEGVIRCLVDDVLYGVIYQHEIYNWVGTYDQPFALIWQIEIGGNNGDPDATTKWPVQLKIDSIWVSKWVPDAIQPPPITGGTMLNGSAASAHSSEFIVDGTTLRADIPGWAEYPLDFGTGGSLQVAAINHGTLPTPPAYAYQVDVSVGGSVLGTLNIVPGSSSSLATTLTGLCTVRLTWKNDAWVKNVGGIPIYDANIQIQTVQVVASGTPIPSNPKQTGKIKIQSVCALTQAEADALFP